MLVWYRHCDLVVVVHVPREDQETRLVTRDGLSQEEARLRLDAQMPIDEKKQRADIIIDNSGSMDRTRSQVEQVAADLRTRAEHGSKQHIA